MPIALCLAFYFALVLSHSPDALNEFRDIPEQVESLKAKVKLLREQGLLKPAKKVSDDPATNIQRGFEALSTCPDLQIPGSAYVVVQGSQTVLKSVIGYADYEQNRLVTEETLFGIGSTTKAFTAFVLGTLVDEGLLTWKTFISDVIPDFFTTKAKDRNSYDAKLEDALTHHLGLNLNNNLWFYGLDPDSAADLCYDWKETFPPLNSLRSEFLYFNGAFALAGEVGARLAKKDIRVLFKERIFEPLGLTNGEAYATLTEALAASTDLASPYAVDDTGNLVTLPRDLNKIIDHSFAAAGSIQMSINGLETYITALINELPTILSSRTFETITNFRRTTWPRDADLIDPFNFWFVNYGFGWLVGEYRGQRWFMHDGGTVGHTTYIMVFPEQEISLALVQNQLGITLFSNIFLALYTYDQLQGYDDSIVVPENICDFASLNPIPGADLWTGLPTNVNNPRRYVGRYCNCLWKQIVVSEVSDGRLSLNIGLANGLLYNQTGNDFLWFGESYPDPYTYGVTFTQKGVSVTLQDDGSDVFFHKMKGNGRCQC